MSRGVLLILRLFIAISMEYYLAIKLFAPLYISG